MTTAVTTEMLYEFLKEFKKEVNQRFEQVDQRFEQVDQRFEQVDKRFDRVEDQQNKDRNILMNLWNQQTEDRKILMELSVKSNKSNLNFSSVYFLITFFSSTIVSLVGSILISAKVN